MNASSSATLTWGLIGASDIAATALIPALHGTDQRLLGVASGSPAHARDYAVQHSIPRVYGDFHELLADDDIEAVYISSKNDLHHAQVLASAAAGKHILCEKPLSLTFAEAASMVRACEAAGVVFAVNHFMPALTTHQRIAQMVSAGDIGEVRAVNLRHSTLLHERLRGWRLSGEEGAGVVFDLSCHDASLMNFVLDRKPLLAAAQAVQQGDWEASSEDASSAVLRYEGDVLASITDAFTLPHAPTFFEVHGDLGSIRATGTLTPRVGGEITLFDASGTHTIEVADHVNPYENTVDRFARAVRGDGRPIVDGIDGTNALGVTLGILDSIRSGGTAQIPYLAR